MPTDLDYSQVIQQVYDEPNNRLRVETAATIVAGAVEVAISDIGLNPDSIKVGDGSGNYLKINADGSINIDATIVSFPAISIIPNGNFSTVNTFNQVLSVASGIETLITTYTVPAGKSAFLQNISAGGSNIAKYNIYKNGILIDKKYTMFGMDLDIDFDYRSNSVFDAGYKFMAGDVINVKVLQNRPYVGDFNARIQVIEMV